MLRAEETAMGIYTAEVRAAERNITGSYRRRLEIEY